MATANDLYFDAAIRHQVAVRRYSSGEAIRALLLLQKADQELSEKLRARLPRIAGRPFDFTSERWKDLIRSIREQRADILAQLKTQTRENLVELGKIEASYEGRLIQQVIPIEIRLGDVSAAQIRAVVTQKPFEGRLLRQWFRELEIRDQGRIEQALQMGMVQGEGTDQMVRRVIGTRAERYADGVTALTRREADGFVRTAVNHVSNAARAEVWEANEDIIGALVWVATLDGRTSPICIARDGKGAPMGDRRLPEGIEPLMPQTARPPAHWRCRSVMVASLDGDGLIGDRPFVIDTRTRAKREVDFRAIAKQEGLPIREVRKKWAAENIGQVPAKTTYAQFLARQSTKFQDEVLGRTRARLYRAGGLKVEQFVDRAGRTLSLRQLARMKPDAFERAGLDPERF